jgi:3-deoxy-7-phosphoheptulonate synthase
LVLNAVAPERSSRVIHLITLPLETAGNPGGFLLSRPHFFTGPTTMTQQTTLPGNPAPRPHTGPDRRRNANSDRTSQTDDERIKAINVLPPPDHLIRFFPISGTPVES